MSDAPTDAEILALAQQHLKAFAQFTGAGEVWFEGEVEFARAVLAKWGTPQPVAREPLTDAQIKELIEDGVFLGNCKEIVRAIERAHGITQKVGGNADT